MQDSEKRSAKAEGILQTNEFMTYEKPRKTPRKIKENRLHTPDGKSKYRISRNLTYDNKETSCKRF